MAESRLGQLSQIGQTTKIGETSETDFQTSETGEWEYDALKRLDKLDKAR